MRHVGSGLPQRARVAFRSAGGSALRRTSFWGAPQESGPPPRPPGLLAFGRHSYDVPEIVMVKGDDAGVRIGSFCSINWSTKIMLGGEHRHDWVSTFPFRIRLGLEGAYEDGLPASKGDVEIGNDVWIGMGALVLSGVTVGDGAVIGAGAVVTQAVPPYAVVAGNPATIVKWRFPSEQREALLRMRWWDWPDEKVLDEVGPLSSSNVDGFLRRWDEKYAADRWQERDADG